MISYSKPEAFNRFLVHITDLEDLVVRDQNGDPTSWGWILKITVRNECQHRASNVAFIAGHLGQRRSDRCPRVDLVGVSRGKDVDNHAK